MRIEKGTSRIVIVAGRVALKFPRIYAFEIIKGFFFHLDLGWKGMAHFLKYELEFMLWRGIFCNFHEFLFCRNWNLPILAPTRFSFFGIFNIQKAGSDLLMSSVEVWDQVLDLTREVSFRNHDPHTFAEPENYCVISGKLAMVDYGDFKTQWILKRYGNSIFEKFDLSYRRDKKFEI